MTFWIWTYYWFFLFLMKFHNHFWLLKLLMSFYLILSIYYKTYFNFSKILSLLLGYLFTFHIFHLLNLCGEFFLRIFLLCPRHWLGWRFKAGGSGGGSLSPPSSHQQTVWPCPIEGCWQRGQNRCGGVTIGKMWMLCFLIIYYWLWFTDSDNVWDYLIKNLQLLNYILEMSLIMVMWWWELN